MSYEQPPGEPDIIDGEGRRWVWVLAWSCYRHDTPTSTTLRTRDEVNADPPTEVVVPQMKVTGR